MAGLFEFPGGKVEQNETPEAALVRELYEELGIEVDAGNGLEALTFASHSYETFHLLMPLYVCRRWRGCPSGKEGQQLLWVDGNELPALPMPEADIPLIPAVLSALQQEK